MLVKNSRQKSDEKTQVSIESNSGTMEIKKLKNDQLVVVRDGKSTVVKVNICFPWSKPGRYISLRDEKNNEVLFITDLKELEESSRQVVEQELAMVGFILQIEKVISVEREFEIRNWQVITRQGPCKFQTERDDWPRQLANGGMLIDDITGNQFYIADPKALDEKSQKVLWAFID